jgi:hypothetical protein
VVDPAVTAEAPIVAGNRAAARERAVGEALRQAVARAYAELLAEPGAVPDPAAPAVASFRAAWAQQPKRYVRTYNLLEEGENAGFVRVRVLADVDDLALRRDLDRALAGRAAATTSRGTLLLAGPGGQAAAESVTAVLGTFGIAAEARPLGRDGRPPAEVARSVAAGARAFVVRAATTDEGPVRGALVRAVACEVALEPVSPAAGAPPPAAKASERGFDAREDVAASRCLRAAAQAAVRAAFPDLGAPRAVPGAPRLALVVTSPEPGALVRVLAALRQAPGVAAVGGIRLGAARAEMDVHTRLAPDALAAALRRSAGSAVLLSADRAGAGRLELTARLATAGEPPPAAAPGSP